jgi:hypothetical protein
MEWREKGLHLVDVAPANRLLNDSELIAALPIANSFIRALTWEATDDGTPVFCMVGWDHVWYVLIFMHRFLGLAQHFSWTPSLAPRPPPFTLHPHLYPNPLLSCFACCFIHASHQHSA